MAGSHVWSAEFSGFFFLKVFLASNHLPLPDQHQPPAAGDQRLRQLPHLLQLRHQVKVTSLYCWNLKKRFFKSNPQKNSRPSFQVQEQPEELCDRQEWKPGQPPAEVIYFLGFFLAWKKERKKTGKPPAQVSGCQRNTFEFSFSCSPKFTEKTISYLWRFIFFGKLEGGVQSKFSEKCLQLQKLDG